MKTCVWIALILSAINMLTIGYREPISEVLLPTFGIGDAPEFFMLWDMYMDGTPLIFLGIAVLMLIKKIHAAPL